MRLSRIYYLLLVVIGSLALASCDDDDKVVDEGLKVLSAETSFGANGGEHEISVNKDVVKAYAADDWLAVNAQGSKVTISTQANVSNESRHTTLVVKSSETDSTIVNVSF
ncbi:MAG TPA: BACON domain-containing carbohydrate-binding protein [Prevotella sp.]|nr:BACON domain-containing carbohydrate-binding protein [Prevotella sp.]